MAVKTAPENPARAVVQRNLANAIGVLGRPGQSRIGLRGGSFTRDSGLTMELSHAGTMTQDHPRLPGKLLALSGVGSRDLVQLNPLRG